ncbi:MAG TPA: hypothetical protein VF894_02225 [Anaeromyxobacter sp.]
MRAALAAALLVAVAPGRAPGAARATLVACAPGYPGSTAEAQPNMDALAAAVARGASWPAGAFAAVYVPSERDGVARLAEPDAAAALVPVPFWVKHAAALKLEPRLAVASDPTREATEVWTLVAKRGRVAAPTGLVGFTISSAAGYAPEFVRAVLAEWGRLPADARIVQSAQVLSALRRAAAGEDVAVLLDGTQAAALPSLPFAGELEAVARSAPIPSGLLVRVADRLPRERWRALEHALVALPSAPEGAAALQALRIGRFVPLGAEALASIERLRAGAAR